MASDFEVHETGTNKQLTQAELDAVRLADLTEALEAIQVWCKAYPLAVFPEPSRDEWRAMDAYLTQGGFSLTRISASNMRHVIEGVAKIIGEAGL
jgi:hypothetical protein